MEWDGIDLREYERMDGAKVPESIQSFLVEQGTGSKIKATTTDFTIKGVRLLIPSSPREYQAGDGLIIYSSDERYKLVGEIVYVIPLADDTVHAGIRFLKTKSLDEYLRLIDEYD